MIFMTEEEDTSFVWKRKLPAERIAENGQTKSQCISFKISL